MKINWKSLYKKIPISIQITKKIKHDITWTRPDDSLDHVGITHHDIKHIVLNLSLKPKEAVHTYLHEVLHAVSEEYSVGLTENQVLALEKAVYYMLKPGNVFKE